MTTKSRRCTPLKLGMWGLLALVVLGLALGLGLGLTIGRNDDNDDSEDSETTPPLPIPTSTVPWKPAVGSTWQIVLLSNIILAPDATSVTPDVSIFDIDLFDTPKETIDTLHRLGKKVICYFSGGSYEPGRPDSEDFREEDMGKELDGWPGERWLQLGSENVRRIMRKRVELAKEKGCDGVDPDNVDGYVSSQCVLYRFRRGGSAMSLPPRGAKGKHSEQTDTLPAKRQRLRPLPRRLYILPHLPLQHHCSIKPHNGTQKRGRHHRSSPSHGRLLGQRTMCSIF